MNADALLRRQIYDITLTTGTPPTIAQLAQATTMRETDVRQGLQQLAAGRIVVLQPASGEILMAPPFSAVPTPFLVTVERRADTSAELRILSTATPTARGMHSASRS